MMIKANFSSENIITSAHSSLLSSFFLFLVAFSSSVKGFEEQEIIMFHIDIHYSKVFHNSEYFSIQCYYLTYKTKINNPKKFNGNT